jgi:hypothetical protein
VHAGRGARLLAVRVVPPADEVRVDSMAFTVRKLFDDETRSRFAERDATRLFFFSFREKKKKRRSRVRRVGKSFPGMDRNNAWTRAVETRPR